MYVGNLSCFVTEVTLHDIFSTLGKIAECKVITDKQTGLPAGFAFVRFEDHRSAELALTSINGRVLYNQELRVNWAFQKEQAEDTSAHFHVFVGDLGVDVSDFSLRQAFKEFHDCSDARVLWDHVTGKTKGYGFVSFRSKESAEEAIKRVNGQYIGHRRVRCSWAQHKQNSNFNDYDSIDGADPLNLNVYVGNLAPNTTDAELRQLFQMYGVVMDVKLYRKGSYAFVHFQDHHSAVSAIAALNGHVINGKALKCSWGRHQARQSPMNMAVLSMAQPLANTMMLQQHQQRAGSVNQLQQQMAQMYLGGGGAMGPTPQAMRPLDVSPHLDPYPYPYQLVSAGMLPPPQGLLPPPGGLSPSMYYHPSGP